MMVVLLGPPGAGKGTHAAAITGRYGIPHVSTGDMLRSAIASGTPVGSRARAIVEAGNLVPDDVMAEMVEERLSAGDAERGAVLDGYPRNTEQAQELDKILQRGGRSVDHVLNLVVADEEIIRRLSGRRTCGSCGATYHVDNAPPERPEICDRCGEALQQRPDDRPEVIERRLEVYRESTEPLIGLYAGRGLIREVNAVGTIGAVRQRVIDALAEATG